LGQSYSGTLTGTSNFVVDPNNNPGFANLGTYDVHLVNGSSLAVGAGGPLAWGAMAYPVSDQYVYQASYQTRPNINDLGAFAYATHFSDPGFEAPYVGTGAFRDFAYNPSGAPWTYSSSSGVAGNKSGFTGGNANAPQGTQVAFLQYYGTISQMVKFTAGTYAISFDAAQRAGQASSQTFRVEVDGTVVGTFTPSGTRYNLYTTNAFTVTAGTHVVAFIGLDPNGGDNTALIDAASIQSAT
jgi:hypothetical protein